MRHILSNVVMYDTAYKGSYNSHGEQENQIMQQKVLLPLLFPHSKHFVVRKMLCPLVVRNLKLSR
jgi:hypothetical protein